jgi:hypothetical protein
MNRIKPHICTLSKSFKMKKFAFCFVLFGIFLSSCGGSEEETTVEESAPEIDLPFEKGGAKLPNEYFDGVVFSLKEVDEKLKYVFELDDMNASEDSIRTELDSMVSMIADAKKVLSLYEQKDWPETANFQEITFKWYNALQGLINDYYYDLAEPMSRPDDSWSDEDVALYDEYVLSYYDFFEIDQEWVTYQTTFAKANNFELKEVEEDHL